MFKKLSIKDLSSFENKKFLVRVDFNAPIDEHGFVADDTRLMAALPTIEYILSRKGSVILMSHLGRPKGEKLEKFSLKPCAIKLAELLGREVVLAPDCIGEEVDKLKAGLKQSEVLLLENLRFYPAEEKPDVDPGFAKSLASGVDYYVNDAFGTAHRKHSSTAIIAQYFPGKAVSGLLMEKEIESLGNTIQNPARPFYAIIGGAKVSSKIGVIKTLLEKVDALFIGGGMSYTFMKAQGIEIGNSIFEEEYIEVAREILEICKSRKLKLYLPTDIRVANDYSNDAENMVVKAAEGIPVGYEGMDIGSDTIGIYSSELSSAKTIFWNGPMGVYEFNNFAAGTNSLAQVLADSDAISIIGGGDCVAAIKNAGLADKVTHISTGGGASLEYIELGHLPGIDALSDK